MKDSPNTGGKGSSRRQFLSSAVMGGFLVAAYGFFTTMIARFLYPKGRVAMPKPMFVTFTDKLPPGASTSVLTPDGEQVLLTNTGQLQADADHTFIAFSSRCPHLGCKVHYEAKKEQFICPCHQGIFDQKGIAVSGPPAQAKQRLASYSVKADGNAVYLLVEVG